MLNDKLRLALTLYPPLAATLGWLVHSWASGMTQKSFFAGLIGGGLCLIWAVLAWLGHRIRAGAIVTLVVMAFVILADTVTVWMEHGFGKVSVTLTGFLGLTILLLTALAHNFGGPHPDVSPDAPNSR